MIIKNCKNTYHSPKSAIFIKECHFIKLHSVSIYHARSVISLLGINILGNSYLNDITCHEMHFYYIETIAKAKSSKHNILINCYNVINCFSKEYGIYVNISQYSYEITIHVINTTIQELKRFVLLYAISSSSASQNTILITKCQFLNNSYKIIRNLFYLDNVNTNFTECQFYYNRNLKVQEILKSRFLNTLQCNFKNS